MEEESGCLLLLSYRCIVTINVLWLFFPVPWVGLQCVIVVFYDNIHLLFQLVPLIYYMHILGSKSIVSVYHTLIRSFYFTGFHKP